jgi:hypothetical protein
VPKVVTNAVNGLPVVRFDGTADFVAFPRQEAIRTVFWVLREDATAPVAVRSLLGDPFARDFHGSNGAPGQIWSGSCCELFRNVVDGQTWLNGQPVDGRVVTRPRALSVVSLVTTGPVRAQWFGAALSSSGWFGDLAELVVYDAALSDDDRRAVENYLAARYALPLIR